MISTQLATDRQVEFSLAVGGMTCGACATRIERRLNRLDGVEASVNYASELANVACTPNIQVERLIEEIEAVGYSARLVEELAEPAAQNGARARSLGRRLLVAAVVFMPLCDASFLFSLVPADRFPYWQWLVILLAAPVVTWAAWPFYSAAIGGLRHHTWTMDTLVSLGILSATGWSLYSIFGRHLPTSRSVLYLVTHPLSGAIYFDVAAGVTTFVLAGRYFEAVSRCRTGNVLHSLAAIGARDVVVLDAAGAEYRLSVSRLRVGDQFVVRPGETVATDGEVVVGHSTIDRSALTGESVPVDVGPSDHVVGGTISVGGRLVVRATSVGRDTQLAQMMRLVEEAQNGKAAVQRLADRISGVFVPGVVVSAALTLSGWLLAGGSTAEAFNAALSVLIIACPCALGLATPTALLVASGRGASLGIFFKNYEALEASRSVDTVVLDKTGTVTEGRMSVTDVEVVPGLERADLLLWAGALEQASEHSVATAIAIAATEELGSLPAVDGFEALPGLGARGVVDRHDVAIGKADLLGGAGAVPDGLAERCKQWEALGWTAVLVSCDEQVVGAFAIADTVRASAAAAVADLQALGLDCVLLTGDSEPTALRVAAAIGVTEVVAGALPADKVGLIRRLQSEGRSVAMVGDGVNDGPALATADLGLAVGSGTDVALNAADLIIVRDNLRVAATAIALARKTLRTIRANLAWAFVYNTAAIPLAALGRLNPLVAAAAMAMSSALVVYNSSRLRHAP